jgi:hypothetical protein
MESQLSFPRHKEVIPVRSEQVCNMGGGVRCVSWQLRGENAAKPSDWAARARQYRCHNLRIGWPFADDLAFY